MTSDDALHIDLSAAAMSGNMLNVSLSDGFFEALEQDELTGGNVRVEAGVKADSGGEVMHVALHVTGEVRTLCDRCLDEVTYDVDVTDTVDVAADDLPQPPERYDLAWDVYEAVVLSLPLQRVHADGDCNADMLARLEGLRPAQDD